MSVQPSGRFPSYYYYRVYSDPGKVWEVLEFNVEIFKALKSLENDHRYGKSGKILENCNAC